MSCYLAVDIGAGSGRHILGSIQNGKLCMEEIYRFENAPVRKNGSLIWDTEKLFLEILEGLRRCRVSGKIPVSVAIDTWGVDYVLLDRHKQVLPPVYCYRDSRTAASVSAVEKLISPRDLYRRTGIQRQNFNTIYQLWCDRESGRLSRSAYFLMLPEYLAWRLTGKMACEYTNATTTGLVKAETGDWDYELLDLLDYDRSLFRKPQDPSGFLGRFSEEIRRAVGFSSSVILCPTHDTASAVAAVPASEGSMYISSGTWSLAGVELTSPVTTDTAFRKNYTNEGSISGKFRFLKNIMGMWPVQNIRRETANRFTYEELMKMAETSDFRETFSMDSPELTAPDNMTETICRLLGRPGLSLPDILSSVYRSLACSYSRTADELEQITGTPITSILIIGGGGSAGYLNRLTAQISGRRVFTGLTEATAAGNILSQILHNNPSMDWESCRSLIRRSFPFREISLK